MKRIKYITAMGISVFITAVAVISCGKTDSGTKNSFDRKAMLQNYADNLMKPSLNELQSKINNLKTATDAFTAAPDAAKLTALQNAWDETYSSWMFANAYNFGPAGEQGIRKGLAEEIGIFPVNTTTIENNITTNNTTLTEFNRDNRGLNAVEYLIFNLTDDNASIVTAFASANRKTYLTALVNKIKSQVDAVLAEWNGAYATSFVNNNGTDVGSSTGQFYNEFVKSYEVIKNFKVGLPLGKLAGQTTTVPASVEARYSRQSLKYLKLHIQAIENIWYGKSKTGADGIGWKEYLESVTGGPQLVANTETQIAAINTALNALSATPSLEQQVTSNTTALTSLHTELQKNTHNFKSDMSSLLGIAITFSSNDGD
ncbi:MAG: imelysin family protein [Ferruginibacter sp.]